jgi:hypothetical protein
VPSLSASSITALPSTALGLFAFRDISDAVHLYSGTATDLYTLVSGDTAWGNVSKSSGVYTATTALPWSFVGFGNSVIATDVNDPIQSITIGDATFADLSSAAPRAYYMAVVRDFLVLGNIYTAGTGSLPGRVWWSAIGDPTSWPTLGSNAAIETSFNNRVTQITRQALTDPVFAKNLLVNYNPKLPSSAGQKAMSYVQNRLRLCRTADDDWFTVLRALPRRGVLTIDHTFFMWCNYFLMLHSSLFSVIHLDIVIHENA